jgi:hypothetical protein
VEIKAYYKMPENIDMQDTWQTKDIQARKDTII